MNKTEFLKFLGGILTCINNLRGDIFGGIWSNTMQVFQSWGFSVSSTLGIWAPVCLVAVLGVAGFLIYIFFDAYGVEKDILGAEGDV